MTYLGIDAGSFNSPSWLAYLDGQRFTLSMTYIRRDSPSLESVAEGIMAIAVDAPQGLPQIGQARRVCDIEARTPTKRLPVSRSELDGGFYGDGKKIAYLPVIRLGVDVFWHHRKNLFDGTQGGGKIMETYPRAVLTTMTKESIPSKRKDPMAYGKLVVKVLKERYLSCPGVEIPSPDQADAMLCAYAARCAVEEMADLLGGPPVFDEVEQVIREGYIVTPSR